MLDRTAPAGAISGHDLPEGPADSAARQPGPPLHGVVDVLRPDRVAGWVIDRRDATAHATVEVRREGRIVASVPANRVRRDLETARVGTGSYGFSVNLDPPLDEGMEFTVTVRAFSPDGSEVFLRPAGRLGAPSGEQRALARLLEEIATCRTLLQGHASETAELAGTLARVELVQARLESMTPGFDATANCGAASSLRFLSVAALITAGLSLALAVASLWS